jgi:hypothetical protein
MQENISREKDVANFLDKKTRFAGLPRPAAAGVLAVLVALIVYGIASFRTGIEIGKGDDLECYKAIAHRVHGGESYYVAAGDELRKRGFPTRSPFNWRLPTLAYLLGALPGPQYGWVAAFVLALCASGLWIATIVRRLPSVGWMTFGCLLVLGPIIYSLSADVFVAHEFWAGTFIMLSLAFHVRQWRWACIACALAALSLRELALPFVILMLVLSIMERRCREVVAWASGIAAFALGMAIHWHRVAEMIVETDYAFKEGWLVFGGWHFVLGTARMDPLLLVSPPWVAAIVFPSALLGFIGWKNRAMVPVALTVAVYVVSFLFVGRPLNRYWGLVYSNIMSLGLLPVPYALRDLLRSIGTPGDRE